MPGIEFRDPKLVKWIFLYDGFSEIIKENGNENWLERVGIRPVFWFRRPVQVLYVV